ELLYGRNAVAEALRGRRQARRLFLAEGVREDERLRALLARAEELGLPVERPPRPLLDDLARGSNHQGVGLEASGYRYAEFDEVVAAPGTVLVLDHVQDPQNVGTLLRTAEAAGVAGVVLPQDRAAAVTPAVVNASAGAVELLAVAIVPNLSRSLDTLKKAGRWVVGLEAGEGAVDLYKADVPTPVTLVVGAEGGGLGQNVRGRCDLLVSLPMRGQIASLNAATAGAIALFELVRREVASA
ncbi:MAG: 23S rRNA (guanosine(2251)-2'-O)-methyltransferase RlmB, partial [Chloroflexota bacterium]|nr:23S rRNA (guanosine(2251)-2'-O)-methyltransferase RlmB [Chloroflexota bacterium]